MSTVPSPRRYYLLKRLEAARSEDRPLDGVWRSKQEAQPGTALPTTFPFRSQLVAVGYTTAEDLDGATVDELVTYVSLPSRDAAAVVAAAANL
jgi:hypothetical protein